METEMTVPVHVEAIPPGTDPAVWAKDCAAHDSHQPEPRYLEQHHVIPRAWQHFWVPDGTDVPSSGIWAPATVPLCRTGHGNVHYWIEAYMRAYPATAGREPRSEAAVERAVAAATEGEHAVGRQEHLIARQALEQWEQHGGSLAALCQAGLLGGIYGAGASTTDG